MLSDINMDYRIIWDNNIILDLFLLRTQNILVQREMEFSRIKIS